MAIVVLLHAVLKYFNIYGRACCSNEDPKLLVETGECLGFLCTSYILITAVVLLK